ncbi:MAG TPA: hypothetical protein VE403_06395 [Sphingomicrobium sp.]|nr:hypothetical protein [Sphingomicrobium sp.]
MATSGAFFGALASRALIAAVAAASASSVAPSTISTGAALASPMRSITDQVLSFEIGAHSSMRTCSPDR